MSATTTKKAPAKKPAAKKKATPKPSVLSIDTTIVVEERQLVDAMTYAAIFASSDEARPVLNAIRFRVIKNRLRLEATDSYSLIRVEVDCVAEDTDFIVSLADVRRVLWLASAKRAIVELHRREHSASFRVVHVWSPVTVDAELVSGHYPPTDTFFAELKSDAPAASSTSLSNTTLGNVTTLLKKMAVSRTYPAATFRLGADPLKPVGFTVGRDDAVVKVSGIVMPVRVS